MRSKQNWKFMLLLVAVSLFSWRCNLDEICERGNGPTINKELVLPTFHSVILDISAEVILKQGDAQKVVVEGQENIIDLIELNVSNNTWRIDFDRTCVSNYNDLTIYITLPEIKRLEINGSGDIISDSVLKSNEISLVVDGSGDMDIAAEVTRINALIDGSGDIFLQGVADEVDFVIRGSGNINAFNLNALRADTEIRGSGSVETTVQNFLSVDIDGSGSVYYKGNPEKNIRVDGSGKVVDAN